MTEFSRAILAKELGEYLLTCLEKKPQQEENIVERECACLIQQIISAMDDETLDDFYCLDRIVNLIHAAGLSTSRHDF